jgi:hypothetical protein
MARGVGVQPVQQGLLTCRQRARRGAPLFRLLTRLSLLTVFYLFGLAHDALGRLGVVARAAEQRVQALDRLHVHAPVVLLSLGTERALEYELRFRTLRGLPHAARHHDVVAPVRVPGSSASLPHRAVHLALQTLKRDRQGRRMKAKSSTREEFVDQLSSIILTTQARLPPGYAADEIIYMFDGPRFHQLHPEDTDEVCAHTGVDARQLQSPPRYSPDMMQCVEHVHGIICDAWWTERIWNACKPDAPPPDMTREVDFAALERIFKSKITPESVAANVAKLKRLLLAIKKRGTGGYEEKKLN